MPATTILPAGTNCVLPDPAPDDPETQCPDVLSLYADAPFHFVEMRCCLPAGHDGPHKCRRTTTHRSSATITWHYSP